MTPSKFKAIREDAGLSRDELAALLRTTTRSVYRYESGQHPVAGAVEVLMEMVEAGTFGPQSGNNGGK